MITILDDILSQEEVTEITSLLSLSEFKEGFSSNPEYKQQVKKNLELRRTDSGQAKLTLDMIQNRLNGHKQFNVTALPLRNTALRFNCYKDSGTYGDHADAAIMGTPPIRSDLSITIFLSNPEDYEGGELTIKGNDGIMVDYKLKSGSAIIYPSYFVHRVNSVTSGTRYAAIGWIQSLIRDENKRALISRFNTFADSIKEKEGATSTYVEATSLYNNLLRLWVEV